MSEGNSERLEARLDAIIESQEKFAQGLNEKLDNTRRTLERETDAARGINNSAHNVLQATEKHLSEQITRYSRFARLVGAIFVTLIAVLTFMGYKDFDTTATKTIGLFITEKKIDSMLKKRSDEILAEAIADIKEEVKIAKSEVAGIRDTVRKVEEEYQKIKAKSEQLAKIQLQDTPSREELKKLEETTQELANLEARGVTLTASDYLTQGNKHYFNKDYKEALIAYDKALAIEPGNVTYWRNKASTLGKLERYDEAIKAYNKSLTLAPNNATILNSKGFYLNRQKHYTEALAAFDKALALNPDDPYAWKNKGDTYSRLGNREQALVHLRKAVELDPSMASIVMEQGLYQALWEDEAFKKIVEEAKKAAGE